VLFAPEITVSTPPAVWLSTGIRELDHAIETLCSTSPNPYADSLSLEAIRRLGTALRACHADPLDQDARLEAQFGVWLACVGLNRVPWGASHGVGHQLGAVTGISHGYCSCILLPQVLNFNATINADRQALVAEALGKPGRTAAEAVGELVAALGLPTALRGAGVSRESLTVIAETSLQIPFVSQNPRKIRGLGDILEILEAAY
jgi:alcohol dehydrogenase class IV